MPAPPLFSIKKLIARIAALACVWAYLAVAMEVIWRGVTLGSETEGLATLSIAIPPALYLVAPAYPRYRLLIRATALVVLAVIVLSVAAPHNGTSQKPLVCIAGQTLLLAILLMGISLWPFESSRSGTEE